MQQETAVDVDSPVPDSASEPAPVPVAPKRAYALDALRGLAILMMVLSGVIPYGTLPSWMYHAQVPPPMHIFTPERPGITWVDIVFPFFLFSMGAAIPLAQARRLESGTPIWKIVYGILWRGAMLAAFAFYRQHVAPYEIRESPDRETWLLALGAMALVFFIWGRVPSTWKPWQRAFPSVIGWIGAIVLLASIHYPHGGDLALSQRAVRQWLERVDIIILVLANVSVFGALIWLATPRSWAARLIPAGLLLAIKIASTEPGWANHLWAWSPLPWLYRMEYIKYLLIILPGTIVGDMLLAWMRGPSRATGPAALALAPRPEGEGGAAWSRIHMAGLGLLALVFSPVIVVGLYGRYVMITTAVAVVMVCAMWLLVRRPTTELERLFNRLFQWGAWWLALGLCFEPYEGGIKKDHPTVSYFFVTLGLGIFALMALMVVIDYFRGKRVLQLLIDNGQNPLLAYIGLGCLVQPLWVLSGLSEWLSARLATPWQGALHGVIVTLALALIVSGFTRLKVFLRA